jgi:hypothetical protein
VNFSTGVAVLGLSLVAANTMIGPAFGHLLGAVNGSETGDSAHHAFVAIIGQLLFVLVLAFIADSSSELGAVIVALLIGLWLLWAFKHPDAITKLGSALKPVQ